MNPRPVADLFQVAKNEIRKENNLNKKTLPCYSTKDMCDGYYYPVTDKFYTFSEFYFDAIKLKMALRRFKQKNKLTNKF